MQGQEGWPLLLPLGRNCYDGFINCGGQDFRLRITLSSSDELKDARVECDWRLKQVLRGWEGVLEKRLSQSRGVRDFLEELTRIVDGLMRTLPSSAPPPPPALYSSLLPDIEAIGWDRVVSVDPSFTSLQFRILDRSKREHFLSLHLSSQGSLEEVVSQFEEELERYAPLWDSLEELDKKTWVLEPERPSWACTQRRIVVEGSTSLQVSVDPLHPNALPECKFLGPDHAVHPLRDKWNLGLAKGLWDSKVPLLGNLQSILGINFPSPSAEEKEDQRQECGICYAHRLEGAVPEIVCDNEHCNRPFHHVCLLEWLKGAPNARQSFNTVFGECPYCEQTITVRSTK